MQTLDYLCWPYKVREAVQEKQKTNLIDLKNWEDTKGWPQQNV